MWYCVPYRYRLFINLYLYRITKTALFISSSCVSSCLSLSLYLLSTSSSCDLLFLLLMFQESADPNYIRNPCYHDGFNITFNASSIYDTECTKKPRNYKPDQKLVMVGAADSDKCRSIVKSIFDFKSCSSSQCSFNGVEQPPVTGEFMVRPSGNTFRQGDEDAKPLNILYSCCS